MRHLFEGFFDNNKAGGIPKLANHFMDKRLAYTLLRERSNPLLANRIE
jgi:hypothetical protein